MDTITLHTSVRIKEVVTPLFRERAETAWANALTQNEKVRKQLTDLRGKLMLDPHRTPEKMAQHEAVIKKLEELEQVDALITEQRDGLSTIPNGAEVIVGTHDGEVTLHPGDNVENLLRHTTLVIKNGVLQEIRDYDDTVVVAGRKVVAEASGAPKLSLEDS